MYLKNEVNDTKELTRTILAVANIVRKTGSTDYIHIIHKKLSADKYGLKKSEIKMQQLWEACLQVFEVEDLTDLSAGQKALAREAVAKLSTEYDFIPKVKLADLMGIRYQHLNRIQKKKSGKMITEIMNKTKNKFETPHYGITAYK